MIDQPYFWGFRNRKPEKVLSFRNDMRRFWHLSAGLTIGFGLCYIYWRWNSSLNPDAMVFSVTIAAAETLALVGTLLFFFDIWDENDTIRQSAPQIREDIGAEGVGHISVDIFITAYDETVSTIGPSIDAAKKVSAPNGIALNIFLLDDGNREDLRTVAREKGIGYLTRHTNRGFKAGNLANALFKTEGDFVVICDADTQLFPSFLENTLGYFRNKKVAWVQTPHWFFDIPEGRKWSTRLTSIFGIRLPNFAGCMRYIFGNEPVGADPFLSEPKLFFDVIQRRRNRNGASFCCGAGSVHRREAIFENAIAEQGQALSELKAATGVERFRGLLAFQDLQPFKFHVSEDIFTSLQLHSRGWTSVYHPEVLAKMLSPWTMRSWTMQKLKYAGGTYDIMFCTKLLLRSGLPWRTRLHYLATFWSYLSLVWIPLLFMAPIFSLLTGVAPVQAYSLEFFLHLVPLLLLNELALSVGCKGYDIHAGRVLSLATLNIQWRALTQVLRGEKPHFPPTPKDANGSDGLRYVKTPIFMLCLSAIAAAYGCWAYAFGESSHAGSLLIANLFWIGVNSIGLSRIVRAALWRPPVVSPMPA